MNTILITGANGEIGHGLISYFAEREGVRVVALDLNSLDDSTRSKCYRAYTGDILDGRFLDSMSTGHDFDTIYHLAALLSTRAERQPTIAHKVNVDGTLNLLEMAVTQSRLQGKEIKFVYPSSIAVYGFPDAETKHMVGKTKEDEWTEPRTMYGINKLYCERLGRYYAKFYRQLDIHQVGSKVDFRCVRFPGLISAVTLPTGGTSDFAPEMLHYAAKGEPYSCFVREDTRIPFMAMPDAVTALLKLEAAPREKLGRQVYNVGSFSPSASELNFRVMKAFPSSIVTFKPDLKRQAILDTWPEDVDDSEARKDWGWNPDYGFERAFEEYLVPAVKKFYGPRKSQVSG
jgi:nucleoside-diphosphate-sugar epimerase